MISKKYAGIGLAGLAGIAALASMACAEPNYFREWGPRHGGPKPGDMGLLRQSHGSISVEGEGSVNVIPDIAVMTLGAETQAVTWEEASSQARKRAAAIRDAIAKFDIAESDIATRRIEISPVMNYQGDGAPEVVGYRGVISIEVRAREMERAGPMADAAIEAGANMVHGPSFEISGTAEADARAVALDLAMRSARRKADILAKAGDFGIGRVVAVEEGLAEPVMPRPVTARMMVAEMASADAPQSKISAGSAKVSSRVSVSFDILPSSRDPLHEFMRKDHPHHPEERAGGGLESPGEPSPKP